MANPFPKLDEQSPETIIAYQVQATQRNESVSLARLTELELNRQYYSGNQWNEVAQDTGPFDQAVTPMTPEDRNIPMPVLNKIAPIVDGESARLIASTLKPRVDPNDRTTRVARASRLSSQVLDDICEKNNWVRASHKDRRDATIYGTSFIMTCLELDTEELKEVPSPIFGCGCGWKISAEKASMDSGVLSVRGKEALSLGAEEPDEASGLLFSKDDRIKDPIAFLNDCPSCKGEIKSGIAKDGDLVDTYGNSLRKKIPTARVAVRNVSVFDVCPEGGGRSNDGSLQEYTIESIVPVDWICKRHTKGREVRPRSLGEMSHILKWHPSGIDFSGTGGYFGSPAYLSEERWAAYRMTVRLPFYNRETKAYESDGRLIISGNDTVLYHGPLMIHHEDSGRRIPRVKLHPAQYTSVEGSIWGIGAVRRVRKIQDAINTCVAQVQYARHVWGNPRMIIPQGTTIEYMGQTYGGYQGDAFSYSGDAPPDIQKGEAINPEWHSEVELYDRMMSDVSNQADIDRGIPPGGVPSASGLMFLGEQAGAARKPLSQRFAEREAGIFRHMLELANATYDTPQQLMVADRGDKRTVKTFTGTDLLWQVDVKVEVQPAFDSAVFRRQATSEALQNSSGGAPLLNPTTPLQRRRVAEALGVPPELDSVPSQQIEAAENEWLDYAVTDEPVAPIVKKQFDNHSIHIEQHFTDLRSADGEPLTRFWSMVELATDGWDETLTAIETAEESLKLAPPGPEPEPAELGIDGKPDPISMKMKVEKWIYDREMQEQIAAIPKNTELRIFDMFQKMLAADQQFSSLDPQDKEDAMMFTRWIAHIQAHVREENKRSASATLGTPELPAPGGAPSAQQ